jgi:hypothetical protein
MRAAPASDSFVDGQPTYLLREKDRHAGELGPSAFGQFQNIIDIEVLSLD